GEEVSLPRHCHPCSQRAGTESCLDAKRALVVINGLIKHDLTHLDPWKERSTDTRLQRRAVERMRPIHLWHLVERCRRRFGTRPVVQKLPISPPFHSLILYLC